MAEAKPPPILGPEATYASIGSHIGDLVLRPTSRAWWIGFGLSSLAVMLFLGAAFQIFTVGVGLFGINATVVWGFDITNYVWWIGIGNAGTLISAMLYLARQEWRTSINRFAEAMTVFAVGIAGLFPILHLGRPYLFYWLVPYPNVMEAWPQFRSPLVWDMFAILTYLLVSILFWYLGMIPDFATLRDRARSRGAQLAYGLLALGWRGSAQHWQRYERAYMIMAALAVPLVFSVHSVVGYDFAVALTPGWRSTIFPPYFVVGAMFSGFAIVILITVILRALFRLHAVVTQRHLEVMAKILLAASLVMGYSYAMEIFMPWYEGNGDDWRAVQDRLFGPYAPAYWGMIFGNVIAPQLCWSRRLRNNTAVLVGVAILVSVGMWLERYVIVVQGLSHGFIPAMYRLYFPTLWDWAILSGSVGLFLWFFFLFARFAPVVPMHELRKLAHDAGREP